MQQFALGPVEEVSHRNDSGIGSLVLQWVASAIPCCAVVHEQRVTIPTGRSNGFRFGHNVVGRRLFTKSTNCLLCDFCCIFAT